MLGSALMSLLSVEQRDFPILDSRHMGTVHSLHVSPDRYPRTWGAGEELNWGGSGLTCMVEWMVPAAPEFISWRISYSSPKILLRFYIGFVLLTVQEALPRALNLTLYL